MKKSLTLIELLLSISLILVIVLAATSIDLAARNFFRSSERKTDILNEITMIMEHIQKSASRVHGWTGNKGFVCITASNGNIALRLRLESLNSEDAGTPTNFSDDKWVVYNFYKNQHELRFCTQTNPAGSCITPRIQQELLSQRIIGCTLNPLNDDSGIAISITNRFDITSPMDPQSNPEIQIQTNIFFGENSLS